MQLIREDDTPFRVIPGTDALMLVRKTDSTYVIHLMVIPQGVDAAYRDALGRKALKLYLLGNEVKRSATMFHEEGSSVVMYGSRSDIQHNNVTQ